MTKYLLSKIGNRRNKKLSHSFIFRLAVSITALFVAIFGLSNLTYWLSGSEDLDFSVVRSKLSPNRQPLKAKALHTIAEWNADKIAEFSQAPSLDDQVFNDLLPPVKHRLPTNPLVISPAHQTGPYGGTWTRYGTSPSDIGIFHHRLAYDGLVRWDPMGQKILPNLVTHWNVTDEGRTYTFYLRQGVKWSDGHPFTADDIIFWYQDVLLNADLTPVVPVEYQKNGKTVEVTKLDDFTIRFTFSTPSGLFLKRLASNLSYNLVHYPSHYLKRFHPNYQTVEEIEKHAHENGKDFWYQVFQDKHDYRNVDCPRLWAWTVSKPPPARPAEFIRNPYYWKVDPDGRQLPYIDRITFDIYDLETINIKAINGEIGMQGRHLTFQNYPIFMANQERGEYKLRHWIDGGDGTTAVVFNLNHKDPVLRSIFNKRDFRIAMSLAIDRDAIREAAFLGVGESRQISPPPISLYHVPEHAYGYLEFNPEESNRLLDGIGLTQVDQRGIRLRPDGQPIKVNIETSSTMLGAGKMFEMIAANWRAVGVDAKVKSQARQLYAQRRNALLCDVLVWGGAGEIIPTLDPRWFLPYSMSSFHGLDYARWYRSGGTKGTKPPKEMLRALELFTQLESTIDEQEQIRLFKQIIKINLENLWVIGTVGAIPQLFIVNNNFRNVPEVAVGCWPLRTPGATAPESYAIDKG
ncbi:MAG: ABC transporter substrate-binding protein [Candidatus Latescibacterota bacterium]|nr:ABC transporter substrate-binding protein [Candidatus Latescibacterota bacterium]